MHYHRLWYSNYMVHKTSCLSHLRYACTPCLSKMCLPTSPNVFPLACILNCTCRSIILLLYFGSSVRKAPLCLNPFDSEPTLCWLRIPLYVNTILLEAETQQEEAGNIASPASPLVAIFNLFTHTYCYTFNIIHLLTPGLFLSRILGAS